MRRLKVRWAVTALTMLIVCIAFVYSHQRSSRLDAFDPYMRPFVSLDQIQQVADEHSIPLEPSEPQESQVIRFQVPLDGSRSGEALNIAFLKGFVNSPSDANANRFGLFDARVLDRNGKTTKQWFCVLR